jgi:hypothetical protein
LGIFCNRASERKQEGTSSKLIKNISKELIDRKNIVFDYYIKGDASLQNRTIFLNNFYSLSKKTKVNFVFIQLPRTHNGCRPRKIRRV